MNRTLKSLLLSLAFLVTLSLQAHALPEGSLSTYQVASSSVTTIVVAVSSTTATQVDNPALTHRLAMEIQNTDGTASLWCSPLSNVTTSTGRKIASGSTWNLSFASQMQSSAFGTPTLFHIYCLSDSTSATSNAVVTQAY